MDLIYLSKAEEIDIYILNYINNNYNNNNNNINYNNNNSKVK